MVDLQGPVTATGEILEVAHKIPIRQPLDPTAPATWVVVTHLVPLEGVHQAVHRVLLLQEVLPVVILMVVHLQGPAMETEEAQEQVHKTLTSQILVLGVPATWVEAIHLVPQEDQLEVVHQVVRLQEDPPVGTQWVDLLQDPAKEPGEVLEVAHKILTSQIQEPVVPATWVEVTRLVLLVQILEILEI